MRAGEAGPDGAVHTVQAETEDLHLLLKKGRESGEAGDDDGHVDFDRAGEQEKVTARIVCNGGSGYGILVEATYENLKLALVAWFQSTSE